MGWVQVWGPSIVASVLAVIVATALSVYIGWNAERNRRQGVRALLSAEIFQNQTVLVTLVGELSIYLKTEDMERDEDARVVVATFHTASKTPVWETSRWSLPDVGVALTPAELTRLTEWYVRLSQVSLLYDNLHSAVARLNYMSIKDIPAKAADAFVSRVNAVLEFATSVKDSPPPLPDKRFDETDAEMKQYLMSLLAREASAQPKQPE